MTVDELRARQSEIKTRLGEIDAEFAGEELSSERRAEWNSLNEEHDRNDTRIRELDARAERLRSLSESEEHREEPTGSLQVRKSGVARGDDIWDLSTVRASVDGPEEATREMQDRAKRAIEQATFPHENASREDTQAHVERLMGTRDTKHGDFARRILSTGSPTYRRAFARALAEEPLSPDEQRALSLTGENGGYAVPYTLDPTIIPTSNGVVNPLRAISRVDQIVTDTWKGVSSAGVTAEYAAEATEAKDNAPKLAQPEVSTEKAQVFVPYSIEVGMDWGALESELARLIQDAKDTLEAEKFLSGTGENQPYGLLTGAEELVETITAATFAVGDIYALKGKLPARFVPNASWVANDAIYDKARQFDTGGGADLWVRLKEGRPSELVGKPAYELSTMATAINKEEKKILVYGDFSYFLIVDRIGLTVETIPHLFGENRRPTGQRGLYAYWRNGSKVLSKAAFRVLKVKKE